MGCCGGKVRNEYYSENKLKQCECLNEEYKNAKTEEQKERILDKLQNLIV